MEQLSPQPIKTVLGNPRLWSYSQYSQGREATVQVGADGYVHQTFLAYVDGGYPSWWHSEIGGGWAFAIGMPIGGGDQYGNIINVQMAINAVGVERFCFVEGGVNSGINYLYLTGDTSARQTIDNEAFGTAGIAVDANGAAYVAYPTHSSQGGLAFASNRQGGWSIQNVELAISLRQ